MAYREVGMWEILNVLRRMGRGETKSSIKKATGLRRKTIRRYVELAIRLGWAPGEAEPTEELAAKVYEQARAGDGDRGPGEAERILLPRRDKIEAWLKPEDGSRGLRLTKVHVLLERDGVVVPYSSLHRFAVKHCGFCDKRRLTVRVAGCEPGEIAEVDFGRLGLVPFPETGARRVLHALIVTLVYSRHLYVHTTHSQKLEDLIDGLEDAWEFFGGVTARLIIDNLKAAVTKPDRYAPFFQRTFEEYALHRGFIIDSTVPGHAKGKPHVERNVPYVRESFFRGEEWLDRDHVQRKAIGWCLHVAGTRVHGTTRKKPLAVFENLERQALAPIVKDRFDTPQWAECKVHPDHHVQFQRALYSVPTRHVGKTMCVRGDKGLVRVYLDGRIVKTHPRKPPGGRSTDYDDYPEELAPYAMRDPERMKREAGMHGEHLGRFMSELLAGPFPWARLRQAQKLLRLGNKYGWQRVDGACRRALAFDVDNVHRLERIIKQGLDSVAVHGPPKARVTQMPMRFERPATSFSHHTGDDDDRGETIAQNGSQETVSVGHRADAARPGRLREEDETR
jgi:hypothetical protein